MHFSFQEIELNLKYEFTTARDTKKNIKRIIVKLSDSGFVGYGEAAPSPRYDESIETVRKFIQEYKKLEIEDLPIYSHLKMLNNLNGNYSARSAIDSALYDLHSKKLNLPLWKYFGFNPKPDMYTSFTIGIDSIKNIEKKLEEADEFKILKIKLGCENDIEIIQTIRRRTDKILRIDVNEGWKNLNHAIEMVKFLEDQNVELIEQPFPSEFLYENNKLREKTSIPIFADESCRTFLDLISINEYFDGINIKISKCGGIFNAILLIQAASFLNLKTMLGCMIESSIGISAAAQLSPAVDYLDLDGNLLIDDDPFKGVVCLNGKIILNDQPGIGVSERKNG